MVSTTFDPMWTVVLGSNQSLVGQSGGSTNYNSAVLEDHVSEALFKLVMTEGAIVVERSTALATGEVALSAIDFSRPLCSGP